MQNANHLVWMDLEMTGLDPQVDTIIEIATIVTDSELNTVAEGPVRAIHQPDEVLAAMNKWCRRTHKQSGLTERVRASTCTMAQAEAETLAFVRQYVPERTSPLCGNSIWQDRRFLSKYMPELEAYFHYRLLDVSTLKILGSHWYPDVAQGISKNSSHLALDDIRDSIAELAYYREKIFR